MDELLLSIVVPTKNRTKFLISFAEMCAQYKCSDFELVIQDNSDDNREIAGFLKEKGYPFVSYYYNDSKLSMSENSNLGISNAKGKYICFMGDDDLVSGKIIEFVRYMDRNNIEAAVFNRASYYWPGVRFKIHKFPNLVIPHFSGAVLPLNAQDEYLKLLHRGATSLGNIPHLYHGVLKRKLLQKVKEECGTFFPGPSPDIAVAVAVSKYVQTVVYCDAPLVSSGVSPKSSAGLGAKHMHKGDLKTISFLPDNIEEKWDKRIPMTWTGPTIYAESTFEAMRAIGREQDIDKQFNFPYFYAFFDVFCSENKAMTAEIMKRDAVSRVRYLLSKTGILAMRGSVFAKNVLLLKCHLGAKLFDNIDHTCEAERIIDKEINQVGLAF